MDAIGGDRVKLGIRTYENPVSDNPYEVPVLLLSGIRLVPADVVIIKSILVNLIKFFFQELEMSKFITLSSDVILAPSSLRDQPPIRFEIPGSFRPILFHLIF
jgi:hypothetical protein